MVPLFTNELARLKVKEIEMRARGPSGAEWEPRRRPVGARLQFLHRRTVAPVAPPETRPPIVLLTAQNGSLPPADECDCHLTAS
jgi:hypothetical protein